MNNNFSGVNFAYQKVTPTDDSVIRRFAFADGILYGCGISFSGKSVAMDPGQLMICGRQIRHTTQSSWMLSGQENGYARVVLTIDLTAAATEDVFRQIETSVEYADYADGFPELIQEDIFAGGSKYQVAICTASLFAGSVTGVTGHLKLTRSDSTVLLWEGDDITTLPKIDTPRYRFFWVLACHETYSGIKTERHASFIVSNTEFPQKITAFDAPEWSERTVTVTADGLDFGATGNAWTQSGMVNDGRYCTPVRIYGVQ